MRRIIHVDAAAVAFALAAASPVLVHAGDADVQYRSDGLVPAAEEHIIAHKNTRPGILLQSDVVELNSPMHTARDVAAHNDDNTLPTGSRTRAPTGIMRTLAIRVPEQIEARFGTMLHGPGQAFGSITSEQLRDRHPGLGTIDGTPIVPHACTTAIVVQKDPIDPRALRDRIRRNMPEPGARERFGAGETADLGAYGTIEQVLIGSQVGKLGGDGPRAAASHEPVTLPAITLAPDTTYHLAYAAWCQVVQHREVPLPPYPMHQRAFKAAGYPVIKRKPTPREMLHGNFYDYDTDVRYQDYQVLPGDEFSPVWQPERRSVKLCGPNGQKYLNQEEIDYRCSSEITPAIPWTLNGYYEHAAYQMGPLVAANVVGIELDAIMTFPRLADAVDGGYGEGAWQMDGWLPLTDRRLRDFVGLTPDAATSRLPVTEVSVPASDLISDDQKKTVTMATLDPTIRPDRGDDGVRPEGYTEGVITYWLPYHDHSGWPDITARDLPTYQDIVAERRKAVDDTIEARFRDRTVTEPFQAFDTNLNWTNTRPLDGPAGNNAPGYRLLAKTNFAPRESGQHIFAVEARGAPGSVFDRQIHTNACQVRLVVGSGREAVIETKQILIEGGGQLDVGAIDLQADQLYPVRIDMSCRNHDHPDALVGPNYQRNGVEWRLLMRGPDDHRLTPAHDSRRFYVELGGN